VQITDSVLSLPIRALNCIIASQNPAKFQHLAGFHHFISSILAAYRARLSFGIFSGSLPAEQTILWCPSDF
jgi:hypothetical protein